VIPSNSTSISRQAGQGIAIEGVVCCAAATPSNDVADRLEITRTECVDQGGEIVGDIGDGATQAEDYVCESNGAAPMANVVASEGEPIASEGEVCCGAGSSDAIDAASNLASGGVASPVVMTRIWISVVSSVVLIMAGLGL
jgi:hypothetical protein